MVTHFESRGDLQRMLQIAEEGALRATVEFESAVAGLRTIQERIVTEHLHTICDGPLKGTDIVIDYADGRVRARFEGFSPDWKTPGILILLRPYTSKGKPAKHVDRLEFRHYRQLVRNNTATHSATSPIASPSESP